jgi:GTP-binding protein HflX
MADVSGNTMRAALVGIDFNAGDFKASLEELALLARSAGAEPITTITAKRNSPDPAYFVGSGKADEIAQAVLADKVEIVIFNHALSPAQQRNLERRLNVRVVDRTSLILDIFAQRAQSHEGKLQVELAQLQHLATRLIRGWTHLERQKGGIGLRGPGETQLETDRRLIGERVKMLRTRLTKLRKQHETQRRSRGRNQTFSVSLVGYTNAGKSTLFNTLTGAGVFARNLLFATLDTTLRKLTLPDGRDVMLSDTVGFVSELPHDLVAAFRATLEEVVEADLILHVRDVANPDHAAQAADVIGVLNELGVPPDKPLIEVWNKVDLLPRQTEGGPGFVLAAEPAGKVAAVVQVSALTGEGLDTLLRAIETVLGQEARTYRVHVPFAEGADVGWLYGHAQIVSTEAPDETGTTYEVRVDPRFHAAFAERFAGRIAE